MDRNVFPLAVLALPSVLLGQSVSGTVVDDETGEPIPLVNVIVRGRPQGTTTDSLGNFELRNPAESEFILVFSHVSYEKKTVLITHESKPNLEVRIKPIPIRLEEVTVRGRVPFSEQRALYTLTERDFEKLGENNMQRALDYLLPGTIKSLYERMRNPRNDFTLYVDGEWMESLFLNDIDPFSVRRVRIWAGNMSPIGLPLRRGGFVVAIDLFHNGL